MRPHRRQPTRLPVPGILQARTLEWVSISSSNAWKWKVKVKLLSRVQLLATPWTAAHQAPPSMGFSRQEYWSGVPLPSPSGPITSWQIDGETVETVAGFIFFWLQNHCKGDCSHEIKRHLLLGSKVMTDLDSLWKSRYITLSSKVCLVKDIVFPVVMYGCESWEYKESWALKNWCFWTVLLEKTLESPLDCKEIQPVHPKGYQSWMFIGRTDIEAVTPILWLPDAKDDSFEKTLFLGKIEGRSRRGCRGWDGWMASPTQWTWVWVDSGSWWWTGRPACWGSWGFKEPDTTEWLNWTERNY